MPVPVPPSNASAKDKDVAWKDSHPNVPSIGNNTQEMKFGREHAVSALSRPGRDDMTLSGVSKSQLPYYFLGEMSMFPSVCHPSCMDVVVS